MRYFPDGYAPILDSRETERAIKIVKDLFEKELSGALRLSRVTSPIFVPAGSGKAAAEPFSDIALHFRH